MDPRATFTIYYLMLIIASVGVASSALVCWMVTRHVPDLKYFSRQQWGTTIAHIIEVAVFAILLIAPTSPLAFVAVLAIVPAEMIKLYVWFKLMLSLIGLANGIGRARMSVMGTAVATNAGNAAAAIADAAHPSIPPELVVPAVVDGPETPKT